MAQKTSKKKSIVILTAVYQYTERVWEEVYVTACVIHIKPFFLLVDIQHTQCPRWFFILGSYAYKLCGHKTTTQVAML